MRNSCGLVRPGPTINKRKQLVFLAKRKMYFFNKLTTVVPVIGGGQRLGTLVLSKFNVPFTDEDLILRNTGLR